MIDYNIATLKHLVQGGVARTAPALSGRGGFCGIADNLLDPVDGARRQAELSRSTGLDAPPTELWDY